jgi:hypothetical protein
MLVFVERLLSEDALRAMEDKTPVKRERGDLRLKVEWRLLRPFSYNTSVRLFLVIVGREVVYS